MIQLKCFRILIDWRRDETRNHQQHQTVFNEYHRFDCYQEYNGIVSVVDEQCGADCSVCVLVTETIGSWI